MKVELSKDEIERILFHIDCALEYADDEIAKDERIALTRLYVKFEQLAKSQESRQYELKLNFLQTLWNITGI
jgi:hypothetical protein